MRSLTLFAILLALSLIEGRARDTDTLAITDVYPTSDVLPENLLRFYIYFSKPMQREDALASIRLLDQDGKTIEGAFLANRFDLWSADGKRLTLLFDPGRVKTGLVANQTMGRALEAGHRYELQINNTLLAMDGTALPAACRKKFRVVEADLRAISVADWSLTLPASDSREALEVNLGRPHDHVSLAYRLRVRDKDNKVVKGAIELAKGESVWKFTPAKPWQPGDYRLVVDSHLEDVAGNRITGSFERPVDKSEKPKTFERPFTIREIEATPLPIQTQNVGNSE